MFEKVKEKIADVKKEWQLQKDERVRIKKEQTEEAARIERERIQLEKDALMALSEKVLMVEAIMALRETNTRLTNIEEQQEDLTNSVNSLRGYISSLH